MNDETIIEALGPAYAHARDKSACLVMARKVIAVLEKVPSWKVLEEYLNREMALTTSTGDDSPMHAFPPRNIITEQKELREAIFEDLPDLKSSGFVHYVQWDTDAFFDLVRLVRDDMLRKFRVARA